MRLRVCFFTDSTAFGGAEQALLTLLSGLDRSRWEPVLAFHESDGIGRLVRGAADADVGLWPVPPMPEGARGAARAPAFAAAIRRRRPDVFHAHLTWQVACKYALAAAVAARVPAVVATYQLLVDARVTKPTVLQQRALARTVDRAIVVSRELRTYLRQRFGWPERKIRLIHNAVLLREPSNPDPRLRSELSPDGLPIVLTPARLDPLKGHRYLIEAARSLPGLRFVFAGEGEARLELERLVAEAGLATRVTFTGQRTDVAALLACADVIVLPSLAEGLPLAVLEAMAASRPVVATAVGDVPDAVRDGETGILVQPKDPRALAEAIGAIVGDRAFAARLGLAARAHAERCFSASQMVADVTAVYSELLPYEDRGSG